MSREKIVAGNWKMNNDSNQTRTLIGELKKLNQVETSIMIAPAYTNLSMAQDLLLDSKIFILDEATSYIDSYTERQIQKALDEVLKNSDFVSLHLPLMKNTKNIIY